MSAPRRKPAVVAATRIALGNGTPVATYALIAVSVVAYIVQSIPGSVLGFYLTYYPQYTQFLPWTMITSIFGHASILHIGLNMFSLFIFGPILERMLGRTRFLALYLLSGVGGSVAVLLIAPGIGVLGASGALFGLFTAFFVIQRGLGGNGNSLLGLIALNLLIGFIPGLNIAWQAHVGGLVVGGLTALVLMRTRRADQRTLQIVLLICIAVALVALTSVGVELLPARLG